MHFVEKNDDEPALLIVQTCELRKPFNQPTMILLNEEKTTPRFGSEDSFKNVTCYFDTGAINHMSRCRNIFTTLDINITRTVKF